MILHVTIVLWQLPWQTSHESVGIVPLVNAPLRLHGVIVGSDSATRNFIDSMLVKRIGLTPTKLTQGLTVQAMGGANLDSSEMVEQCIIKFPKQFQFTRDITHYMQGIWVLREWSIHWRDIFIGQRCRRILRSMSRDARSVRGAKLDTIPR